MKTLKTLSAALLIAISSTAFAASHDKKTDMNYTLQTYIGAVTQGEIGNVDDIFDKDVKFTTTRGEKIINHNRTEVLHILKSGEHVLQNCSTAYTILESTPHFSLVKVIMKYDNFSKVEYLSLANTFQGWKITGVSTSFI